MPATAGSEWTPRELKAALDREDPLFVLDVRNRDEFEAWRIEGRADVPTHNVPYFDILEEGGRDTVVDSVVAYAEGALGRVLPRDVPVLAVCAKGGTSVEVAEGLRRSGYTAVSLAGGTKGWGDFYDARPVLDEERLTIHQIARPARGCLSYVVASQGEAIAVDALRHGSPYVGLVRERSWRIRRVLDSHAHADHISGGPGLARETGVPYWLHPYDAIHPIDVLPARLTFSYLQDGDEIPVGNVRIKAIHIPGHTLGNIAFVADDRYLLSGDSIFIGSIARPDLGGRGDTWAPLHYRSLQRLLELPDDTIVLPGHFSSPGEARHDGVFAGRLADLRRTNEGLVRAAGPEAAFVRYILSSVAAFPDRYVDIKRVNAGLLEADEDQASELELGKNVCAAGGP